jgi:phage terminase large subunit-like protein
VPNSIALPTPPEFAGLPRLRPNPWPITPYGPFRLLPDGSLEKFPTDGPKVIRWIERNCVFTKDRWAGKPFTLLPWQKQLLIDLFELVYDPELGRMRRRYRTALIGVPKKQGKTELVAALADYFLLGSGEPDPRIACAASAESQAEEVFNASVAMIQGSPTLRGTAQCLGRIITIPGNVGASIRKIPANGGKFDGKHLLIAIADEVHEWLTPNQRKMHGMLSGAQATREEPLHINITTAGEDVGDEVDDDEVPPWLLLYRLGLRVQSGEIDDPSFFFRWWMAPEGADHRDPKVWMDPSCNPSNTVREAYYRTELNKRTESDFRRYFLNQPSETLNVWLDHGTWEACQLKPDQLQALWDAKAPTWIGWDASTKRDSTAVVSVQWREIDGVRRLLVRPKIWERPFVDGRFLESWRVPRGDAIAYVVEQFEHGNIVSCGYDPYFIAWIVEELEDRGLALVEFPQTDQRMSPATQGLFELITEGVLAHDGDPTLTRHIKAAKVKNTTRGQRLTKDPHGRGRKIDGGIALAIAVGEMLNTEAVGPSIYETRGILDL